MLLSCWATLNALRAAWYMLSLGQELSNMMLLCRVRPCVFYHCSSANEQVPATLVITCAYSMR